MKEQTRWTVWYCTCTCKLSYKNNKNKKFLSLQIAGRKGIIAGIGKNEKLRELEMNL